MLSLNSYGLPRSNNNQSNHVTLPRLSVGSPHARTSALSPFSPAPPREARSLSKLELMRRAEHPLYRTTAGYEYGRHLDIPDSALSVPKHARHAGFTQEFVAGPFNDNSLMSIDKSKLRAESWERKVEARTKLMKIKYDELQEKLEVKKAERKREREARRREMEQQQRAAVAIQAHMRGFLARSHLRRVTFVQQMAAAGRIQQVFRSREQVKCAKKELDSKRRQRLDVFANKLQRVCKHFLLKRQAMQQLAARRRERAAPTQKASECDAGGRPVLFTAESAALLIQQMMRLHLRRRVQRAHSVRSNTSTAIGGNGKDLNDTLGDMAGSGPSSARTKQSQRLARRTIVTIKQRKREKSQYRLL